MPALPGVDKGWTVRYTTDLTEEVWFYLRGEEYSAQIDYFVQSVTQRRLDGENTLPLRAPCRPAWSRACSATCPAPAIAPVATPAAASRPSVWARRFG